jgi:NADH dehydrogenase (ubiquinone) Fe-S protein 5
VALLQLSRAKTVKTHFIQKQLHEGKEGRKVADVLSEGVIVGVGLIGADEKSQTQ